MCGFCGEIRFNGDPASATAVAAMDERLKPRGPDGSGIYTHPRTVLAHRRLKIIDPSEQARQPMTDEQLGAVLVYNGAIYNYPELRSELQALGCEFRSTGDTEVILKAYDAWGPACVERFNGMFAFALWHAESETLFVARDRLGIKPLYYAEVDGGWRFASSLPALLAGGGIDTSIDPVALHHYMTFHSVVPPPRTILSGVRKLPPATRLTIRATGATQSETYWHLDYRRNGEGNRSLDDWTAGLGDVLTQAVSRRMIADVPVGVLLSGGLDSSLVVALLAGAGHEQIETFSIGFADAGGETGNEFVYSDLIARTFGTTHHRIEVDHDRTLEALEPCVYSMSEPMVSHDCVGFYLLSQEVSRHVKVVQSGQGADEVFGGYHWYPPMLESTAPVRDYARAFFDRDHAALVEAVHPRFIDTDHSRAFVEGFFARAPHRAAPDQALHLDTTVMLVDDPVKRVDNMTMAWGLEARVPFLDHELVEFAARIPPELKIDRGGKYVLKEFARGVLPADVIDRPKGYFPVPALKYLEGPVLDLVRQHLHDPRTRQRELFRDEYIDRLLADPASHITPLGGSMLWQVGLLAYWLNLHEVPPS